MRDEGDEGDEGDKVTTNYFLFPSTLNISTPPTPSSSHSLLPTPHSPLTTHKGVKPENYGWTLSQDFVN
ncbi:hypothetical protein NSMS1_51390 [Nostoc sp. MS1]|nr:hypothetical protein NSMS1_51390 [Nostoc sp. MS1]